MSQLPLKTRILEYAIDHQDGFVLNDIIKDIEPEYRGERLFSKRQVEEYLSSYLGVEFLTAAKTEFDDRHELVIHYVVTDYGRERERYLPGRKKQ